ncbi:phosphopyruvate hydratase [Candidatus Woesearchaeota archaeon]|nr:phosphopyruvate hydratase [Candidatus Woesearchaeota archaeon]
MPFRIKRILAREILDSRGNPTIEVDVLCSKSVGRAAVPSGASTGVYEAHELRDHNRKFHGNGVLKAIANVEKISKKLKGLDVRKQERIDKVMIDLDDTKNKSKLGANAMLGVSMAGAVCAANASGKPLYSYLNRLSGSKKVMLPVPFCNIINGGKHAGNKLPFQEFMICPVKTRSFSEGVQAVSEIYHTLKSIIQMKYGRNAINVGDEGGFAPPIEDPEEALRMIDNAIAENGYSKEVRIAMDIAASEFYAGGIYKMDKQYNSIQMLNLYLRLAKQYPVISIEDPFDQDDFPPFQALMKKTNIQIVGDDLTVSNPHRVKMAIDNRLCNALLLKVNQIGTLSEALESARMAAKAKWKVMVSHRSGETEDTFIADLAAGLGCGQIKLGAPCRGERTAKYNRLIRIEEQLGANAKYAKW